MQKYLAFQDSGMVSFGVAALYLWNYLTADEGIVVVREQLLCVCVCLFTVQEVNGGAQLQLLRSRRPWR